jgi:hypothetical protein
MGEDRWRQHQSQRQQGRDQAAGVIVEFHYWQQIIPVLKITIVLC